MNFVPADLIEAKWINSADYHRQPAESFHENHEAGPENLLRYIFI
jgi:hypothetical protein